MRAVAFAFIWGVLLGLACFRCHPKKGQTYLWIALLLPIFTLFYKGPLLESDLARYEWEGAAVLAGVDPYTVSPQDAVEVIASEDARQVYSRLSYPAVPSVYPPAVIGTFALFKAVAEIFKINFPFALRVFLLLFLLLTLFLSPLRGNQKYLAILYLGGPLIIRETVIAAHFDIIAVTLVCGSVVLHRKDSIFQPVLLGIACWFRWYPILLAPFLDRSWNKKSALLFIGTAALGMLPWLAVSGGFHYMSKYWVYNPSLFAFFNFLNIEPQISRVATVVAYLAVYYAIFTSFRKGSLNESEACLAAVGAVLLMSPVVNPWYLLWLYPFFLMPDVKKYWRAAAALWSGSVLLSHYFWLQGKFPFTLSLIEYAPVYILIIMPFLRRQVSKVP